MVYANRMACFGRGAPSLWQPLLSPSVWKDKLSDALGPPTAMLSLGEASGEQNAAWSWVQLALRTPVPRLGDFDCVLKPPVGQRFSI